MPPVQEVKIGDILGRIPEAIAAIEAELYAVSQQAREGREGYEAYTGGFESGIGPLRSLRRLVVGDKKEFDALLDASGFPKNLGAPQYPVLEIPAGRIDMWMNGERMERRNAQRLQAHELAESYYKRVFEGGGGTRALFSRACDLISAKLILADCAEELNALLSKSDPSAHEPYLNIRWPLYADEHALLLGQAIPEQCVGAARGILNFIKNPNAGAERRSNLDLHDVQNLPVMEDAREFFAHVASELGKNVIGRRLLEGIEARGVTFQVLVSPTKREGTLALYSPGDGEVTLISDGSSLGLIAQYAAHEIRHDDQHAQKLVRALHLKLRKGGDAKATKELEEICASDVRIKAIVDQADGEDGFQRMAFTKLIEADAKAIETAYEFLAVISGLDAQWSDELRFFGSVFKEYAALGAMPALQAAIAKTFLASLTAQYSYEIMQPLSTKQRENFLPQWRDFVDKCPWLWPCITNLCRMPGAGREAYWMAIGPEFEGEFKRMMGRPEIDLPIIYNAILAHRLGMT